MPTRRTLLCALLATPFVRAARAGSTTPAIQVPVRLHLVTGLIVPKGEQALAGWVTPADLENTVMPEVNRIWRPAGIEFVVEQVVSAAGAQPANRAELLGRIAAARRNEDGHPDFRIVRLYEELLDFSAESRSAVNVHLVPYLGETYQGVAMPRRRRVLVGEWSDKASGARQPPRRVNLAEEEPFREGSLGRTLAHELGHIVGLKHPSRDRLPGPDRLMGGGRPGYHLTEEEIAAARSEALGLRNGQR